MDIFDQYLFEELTTQYARQGLSLDDYEELYQRFCSMDHLPEARPYIWTMRFFGLGTAPEKAGKGLLPRIKRLPNPIILADGHLQTPPDAE